MIKFEKVKRFADTDIILPERKTANSAGYDFTIAEDIIIPSYQNLMNEALSHCVSSTDSYLSLNTLADMTKKYKIKPTLVPTGVKCALEPNTYLELTIRSSSPLKYWLVLANGVGVIDADYYGNEDNDGEIFFQIINFSPYNLQLRKGDIIGQGIIKNYLITDDDAATGVRKGGFGSTSQTKGGQPA